MIVLTIRTDKPESEIGLYEDGKKLGYKAWQAHHRLAETLHSRIEALLSASKKSWQDIGGIVTYKGPGSFTGLRIGISTANTLAYSRGVPITGTTGENWLDDGLASLRAGKNELPVVPSYGSEAHITQPKK